MENALDDSAFTICPEVLSLFEEMRDLRHQLHQCPEILFDLPKTSSLVSTYLQSLPIELYTNIGQSGVVGILRNEGPCILLRADMDALNITEVIQTPIISKHPGKMHACGHDGHMAMLLIAAKVLSQVPLKGSVKFVFQPAEEGGHGAREMINDKNYPVMQNPGVDQVYGIHITNGALLGDFVAAPKYASCDSSYFSIEVIGKGGHASTPFLTIDPISAGTHLVVALQTIVSMNIDPERKVVVSVTMIHSGEVFNAIPDRCVINGTIRSFEPEVKARVQQRISELCEGVEKGFRCNVKCEFTDYYSPVINDEQCVENSVNAFMKVSKNANRSFSSPMIGEDFFYFSQEKPGSFIMLGCATPEKQASLHSASFDFDERAMLIGASYWVQLVKELLT